MEKNKTGKYFKYAIGEIVLVVIGILIALQLNNANENWKKEKLRQELLIELRSSMMSDTIVLKNERKNLKSAYLNAKLLIKTINEDLPYRESLDSSLALIELVKIKRADYKIFDRLLNIGIDIIDDKDLINEIIHYYEDSKNLEDVGNEETKLLKEKIYPSYFDRYIYGWKAKPNDFEELKKSSEFKIVLDYISGNSLFLIKRSIHRKNLAAEILKILDTKITSEKVLSIKEPYIKTMEKDSIDISKEIQNLKDATK
jgi:hypothetical protein